MEHKIENRHGYHTDYQGGKLLAVIGGKRHRKTADPHGNRLVDTVGGKDVDRHVVPQSHVKITLRIGKHENIAPETRKTYFRIPKDPAAVIVGKTQNDENTVGKAAAA